MSKFIRFLVRPLVKVLFLLPRSFHRVLGSLIGWLWFDFFRIRRQIVLGNLRLAFPNLTEDERIKLARLSMSYLGRSIVDVTLIPFLTPAWTKSNIEIKGLENYLEAQKNGQGVIFLTLHIGCGDLGTVALSHSGVPLNVISKEFKAVWLNNLWFSARRKHGTKYISDRKSSFEILRALKQKEVVVFVLDQFMGPPLGVRTKFFGIETGTAMGLAVFAERAQCPVLPAYSYYNQDGRLIIEIEPPIDFQRSDDRQETILRMTQIYCDHIERVVRAHPEQWMWVHRRWKEFR